jgi:hypothetical protein
VPTQTVTPSAALAPFHCLLVRGMTADRDPDGRRYSALACAMDQGEALAGLNPDARIVVSDGLGRAVAW